MLEFFAGFFIGISVLAVVYAVGTFIVEESKSDY